ncbi:putative leader peptide [uncultured Friedmanniella sp.]
MTLHLHGRIHVDLQRTASAGCRRMPTSA